LALFDLPGVAAIAADRFAAESLSVAVSGGSFLEDDLPTGADLVTLVRILHDHDDEPVRRLLRAVRKAIAPGGTILIAEPMAGPGPAERVGDAYFGMYLLAMGSGRPRTPAEIMAMLKEAGFALPRRVATAMPMIAQVIVARA
jgi:demethylspheroidene O-methyltransferase